MSQRGNHPQRGRCGCCNTRNVSVWPSLTDTRLYCEPCWQSFDAPVEVVEVKGESLPTLPSPAVAAPINEDSMEYITTPPIEMECGVCVSPWSDPLELVPCGHVYCHGCVSQLPKNSCPHCRGAFTGYKTPHRSLLNMLHSLSVKCNLCGWSGHREHHGHHACSPKSYAEVCKDSGNECFKKGDFLGAVAEYTKGMGKEKKGPHHVGLFNNRALAYAKLGQWQPSYQDASKAIGCDNTNAKAYSRRGVAGRSRG